MPDLHSYDYAIVRIVPCAERGEFLNAGIVLHSSEHGFLESRVRLDEDRLRAFWPEIDYDAVREHLEAFPRIAAGDATAGPIARLSRSERFQWLVSPRSTVIQVSEVHSGMCESPETTIRLLMGRLVTTDFGSHRSHPKGSHGRA